MSLYTSPSARVFTSGFLSPLFLYHEWFPPSPLIFDLCILPLAAHIRDSPYISGISIDDEDHKMELYTDDIVINCTSP